MSLNNLKLNNPFSNLLPGLGHEHCITCKMYADLLKEYGKTLALFYRLIPEKYYGMLQRKFTIVLDLLAEILSLSMTRTHLIDKQICFEEFSGELHEQYHQTTDLLGRKVEQLFSAYKSVLNYTISIIETEVKSRKFNIRGIKFASFSKFINTSENAIPPLKNFMKSIRKLAKEQEEILDFRDHIVDHQKQDYSLDTQDSKGKFEIKYFPNKHTSTKKDLTDALARNNDVLKLEHEGHKLWYIHVEPLESFKDGSVSPGQGLLGMSRTKDLEHFKKYDSHYHTFGPTAHFLQPNETEKRQPNHKSPDLLNTFHLLCHFLTETFIHLDSLPVTPTSTPHTPPKSPPK